MLRCTFKHKIITRCSVQTSKNKQALLPDWQYFLSSFSHSHISLQFFCLVHLQQTAKTAIIKPVPLINWPSDKFDSRTFDLGRTSDSFGFSWRASSTFSKHSRWVSDIWSSHHVRKNMNTCSQAPTSCWQHMPVPLHHSKVEIAQLRERQQLVTENGCRHKSDQGEREKTYTNRSPILLKFLAIFQGSNMWNKFLFKLSFTLA